MKILQVNNFHYLRGGADKVYLETANLLAKYGHEVQFFSTKDKRNVPSEYDRYFVDDIDYYKQKNFSEKINATLRFFYYKTAADKLARLIVEQKPDIAHIHIFQGRLSCSILPVLKKHKIPIVFSLHEYKILCPVYTLLDNKSEVCEACQGKFFYNCVTKKCNRNSVSYSFISAAESYLRDGLYPIEKFGNHFIMVSDFIYKKHIQYRPTLAGKSSRLYNFNAVESQPQKSVKGDYFLYFGRLSGEKGIRTMLQAFIELPNLKLKVVGTGAMQDEIDEFIKTNAMGNVEVLGYKEGNELKEIISNASFTIVPSEWYESFGLTILESLTLGTPVIGANIGAIPELVRENENGFLFQPKNVTDMIKKIEKANSITPHSYQFLAENGRHFALTNFTKEDYYHQLLSIYKNSIKSYNEKN